MMRSLFSAVSGLKNHQTAMDIIGNNISNVNTTAFKASSVIFTDIYSQTISTATAPSATTGGSNAQQVGLGMSISAVKTNMTEGSTQTTDGNLDFSVTGEGYFIIRGSDGKDYYTRNGSFKADSDGYLVTDEGEFVLGYLSNDPNVTNYTQTLANLSTIQMTGASNTYIDYAIDSNGLITAYDPATDATVTIGRLVLATFSNASGLEKEGGSQYAESANSGTPTLDYANEDFAGSLAVGSLEMSNVNLATELTNMIIMQRGFQANSRVITTSDTMLEELVNLKRS
ncbi:flagellar hook-basal body complex protein [Papillibacter cinnamivorans]|uniref:Flagellar hook protein FlgE n=1 Tax=Papillibacter cinnamivorans DSM 12816 TaxID=1122930 RepID=A0A1W1YHV0_9FIRM|nr:flagellar hook-basal body complex protein [Papillibacter cinnamivorans]SMC35714.1 flagellar hook protein FlgE [Papillibacter cinnamivorans DSM 12816]